MRDFTMEELLKDRFSKWYLTQDKHKYSLESCFACLQKTSDYAVNKKISKNPFCSINDCKEFNIIRNMLMANRMFKYYDKRNFLAFDKIGQYYSLFLRDQASLVPSHKNDISELLNEKTSEIDFNAFQQWLTNTKGLTVITSSNYRRAIEKLIDRDYNSEFNVYFVKNNGSLLKAVEELEIHLKQNEDYLRLDKVNHGAFRAAIVKIKEYLSLDDSDCDNRKEILKLVPIEEVIVKPTIKEIDFNLKENLIEEIKSVDWSNLSSYLYTTPLYYEVFEIKYPVKNWASLLVSFCGYLIGNYNDIEITSLNWNGSKRKLWATIPSELIAPKQLKDNLYIESNYSSGQIASFLKALADHYKIDLTKFNVYYKEKSKANTFQKKQSKISLTSYDVIVDFNDEDNILPFARPLYYSLRGIKKEELTWIDCLVDLSKELLNNPNCVDFDILNFITNMPKDLNEDHYATRELFNGYYIQILFQVKAIIKAIKKLLDFTDTPYDECIIAYRANEINKISRTIVANKINILEDNDSVNKVINVLRNKFGKGFILNSVIDIKKFKRFFYEIYNEECLLVDEDIKLVIENNTIAIDDNRMFLVEQVISNEILDDIKIYIGTSFENSKIIYYKIIFDTFENKLFTTRIYDEKVLKVVLQKELGSKYSFKRSYMAVENIEISVTDEIKNVLVEAMCPVSIDDIIARMPYISPNKIKNELAYHEEFISTGDKKYFHIECFDIQESELISTENIIRDLILENGYASKKAVVMNIETMDYKSNNILFNEIGICKALAYLYRNKFEYNGFIFSSKDNIIDINKILSHYVQYKEEVSLGELGILAEDIGINSLTDYYITDAYKTHMRIDKDTFVKKETIQFDIEFVDKILSKYVTDGYCSIGNIKDYALFPSGKYSWNENLLQTYLRFYSGRFKYVTDSISLTRVVGAIVDKTSHFDDINEIMTMALANSYVELTTNDALSFLVDEKYLSTRRFKNIEEILEKAKGIRG